VNAIWAFINSPTFLCSFTAGIAAQACFESRRWYRAYRENHELFTRYLEIQSKRTNEK
jgi:hypothetical protein